MSRRHQSYILGMNNILSKLLLLGCAGSALAAWTTPYDPIALPGGEHPDRRVLDSLNVKMGTIRINQSGYVPGNNNLFYVLGNSVTDFAVVLASDSSVLQTGTLVSMGVSASASLSIRGVSDALTVANGTTIYTLADSIPTSAMLKGVIPSGLPTDVALRIQVGNEYSADFVISSHAYTYVRNASLRFLGLQHSKHNLDSLPGGWYDCGDYLKESQTQSYAAAVLGVLAATQSDKDKDQYDANLIDPLHPDGIPDVLGEAKYGADYALASYELAGGIVDSMKLSVGDFGKDHSGWNLPLVQQAADPMRGGAPRSLRAELGSTTGGLFAADLAFVSRLYASKDSAYAAKALLLAKKLYEYGKLKKTLVSSFAYNGNNEFNDDLGLAAIGLLYATRDTVYLNDLVERTSMAKGQTKANFAATATKGAGMFNGGWFAQDNATFLKNVKNTSWANSYAYGLYAFYKLILASDSLAGQYGISPAQRLQYAEDVAYTMASNLGDMSISSGTSVALPVGAVGWKSSIVIYDPTWFRMFTDQTWYYNRYQAGNSFEVLAYADVTKDLQGVALPQLGVKDWKSAEMQALGVHQMDYLLGLNPWGISFISGIGDRNLHHPHSRQANPDGRNIGDPYEYSVPVGGLIGSHSPATVNSYQESYEQYSTGEMCLDGGVTLLSSLQLLADNSSFMVGGASMMNPKASNAAAVHAVWSHGALTVDANLSAAEPIEIRWMRVDGHVLTTRVVQGQRGSNHWVMPVAKAAGVTVLQISGKQGKQTLLIP